MQDDRNRICQHIRAARNWLGQAEQSLENKKDIQGNLKLMLAKAELQHTEERRGKVRTTITRMLPVITAGALAATIIFAFQEGNEAPTESTISNSHWSVETLPNALEESQEFPMTPVAASSASENITEEITTEETPIECYPVEKSVENIPQEMISPPIEADGNSAAKFSDVEPAAIEQPVSQLPSRDMQKLMQSAGKILREN